MYSNDYQNDPNRLGTNYLDRDDLGTRGPGVYYTVAGLLVVCAVAAAFIFSGNAPHEQLAQAPAPATERALPAPAPTMPGTPSAAPGAARLAPAPAPAAPQQ